ncbi:uncharacterized protein VTP21DRAFT_3745 [Calcarisporiella thermophila]|uniref:uncharacterized protein n=1 Tax=Calcarisporiella thermophila TaxID=911321 RepID=UPI0037440083
MKNLLKENAKKKKRTLLFIPFAIVTPSNFTTLYYVMIMRRYLLIALFLLLIQKSAAVKNLGQACDPTPIYSAALHYIDDCDSPMLACDPGNHTCVYRGCRNTDYIPGWIPGVPFPMRCSPSTSFCPDNNLKCQPLKPYNTSCEPSRDDECFGTHSICLNQVCQLKIRTLGQPCVLDVTQYRRTGYGGEAGVVQTIVRDDCMAGTFCAEDTRVCVQAWPLGKECSQDRECLTGACGESGLCDEPPETYQQIGSWAYVLVGLGTAALIAATMACLWMLHRHYRKIRGAKRARFFSEQESFRQITLPGLGEGHITLSTPNSPMSVSFSARSRNSILTDDEDDSTLISSVKSPSIMSRSSSMHGVTNGSLRSIYVLPDVQMANEAQNSRPPSSFCQTPRESLW